MSKEKSYKEIELFNHDDHDSETLRCLKMSKNSIIKDLRSLRAIAFDTIYLEKIKSYLSDEDRETLKESIFINTDINDTLDSLEKDAEISLKNINFLIKKEREKNQNV